jgi:hypothetical protein
MNHMKLTKKRNALIAVAFIAALSGGAAQASIVWEGDAARAYNNGNTLVIDDTKADGDNAYANWNHDEASRVTATGGDGIIELCHGWVACVVSGMRRSGHFEPRQLFILGRSVTY